MNYHNPQKEILKVETNVEVLSLSNDDQFILDQIISREQSREPTPRKSIIIEIRKDIENISAEHAKNDQFWSRFSSQIPIIKVPVKSTSTIKYIDEDSAPIDKFSGLSMNNNIPSNPYSKIQICKSYLPSKTQNSFPKVIQKIRFKPEDISIPIFVEEFEQDKNLALSNKENPQLNENSSKFSTKLERVEYSPKLRNNSDIKSIPSLLSKIPSKSKKTEEINFNVNNLNFNNSFTVEQEKKLATRSTSTSKNERPILTTINNYSKNISKPPINIKSSIPLIYSPAQVVFEKEISKGEGTNQSPKYQGELGSLSQTQTFNILEDFVKSAVIPVKYNENKNSIRSKSVCQSQILDFKYNKGTTKTQEQIALKRLKKQNEAEKNEKKDKDSFSSQTLLQKVHSILPIEDLWKRTEDFTKVSKIEKTKQKQQNGNEFNQYSNDFSDSDQGLDNDLQEKENEWEISIDSKTLKRENKSDAKDKIQHFGRSLTPTKILQKKENKCNSISPINTNKFNDTTSQDQINNYIHPLELKYGEQLKNYKQNKLNINYTPKATEINLIKPEFTHIQYIEPRIQVEHNLSPGLNRENVIPNIFSKQSILYTGSSRNESSTKIVKKQVKVISPRSPFQKNQHAKESSNSRTTKSIYNISENVLKGVDENVELSQKISSSNRQRTVSPINEINLSTINTLNTSEYYKVIQKRYDSSFSHNERECQKLLSPGEDNLNIFCVGLSTVSSKRANRNRQCPKNEYEYQEEETQKAIDNNSNENESNTQLYRERSQDGVAEKSRIFPGQRLKELDKTSLIQLDGTKNNSEMKRNNNSKSPNKRQ